MRWSVQVDRRSFVIAGGAVLAAGGTAVAIGKRQMGSMAAYSAAAAALRAPLALKASDRELIRYATLAPNGHNTQPWLFRVRPQGFEIRPDFSRRTPAVDPDDHHVFVSLGCAAENLMIAAAAQGRSCESRFVPDNGGSLILDTVEALPRRDLLLEAIPKRQSTRAEYDGQQLGTALLQQLAASVAIAGVDLALLTDRAQLARVRDLVIAGNTAQMADAAFVAELKRWIRFNPGSALARRDGLFTAASGNPALPDWLAGRLFDLSFTASAENDRYAKHIDSSAGVAVLVAEKSDPEHWALVGRACQRFALQATAMGLKLAFINQPVEVPKFRGEAAALAGFPGRRPDIVMRFGRGPTLPMSLRRPVNAVMLPA